MDTGRAEPWTPGPWGKEKREDWPGGIDITGATPDGVVAVGCSKADARLIRLAPEMAELLEEWDDAGYSFDGLEPVVVKTRALLAKARGQEPESHGGDS